MSTSALSSVAQFEEDGVLFKKTILPNGIRVLTESHALSHAVAAAIWVEVGTREEQSKIMGASHMVEHMVFKGTHRRSAYEIALELEAVGGEINAYTTREYTCFHTLSLKDDLNLGLDVLSDLVLNAKFDAEDFEREREVILQEIYMSKDQLEDCIYDVMFEAIYPKQSVGYSILGSVETIQNITREQVFDYYKTWYQPQNLIVTVTGACDHESVVQFINERFGHLPATQARHKRPQAEYVSALKSIKKPAEQVHLLMSWPTTSYSDTMRFEAFICNAILGGGMTSRLYQRIREDLGLAYSVYSTLNSYEDSGLSLVYVGTTKEQVTKAIEEIKVELQKLKTKGLSFDELNKFKKQLRGQILLGADDIENRMSSLGINEMVYKTYRSVDYVLKQIEEVSVDSLNEYLDKHFDIEKISLFLLGDVVEEKKRGKGSAQN